MNQRGNYRPSEPMSRQRMQNNERDQTSRRSASRRNRKKKKRSIVPILVCLGLAVCLIAGIIDLMKDRMSPDRDLSQSQGETVQGGEDASVSTGESLKETQLAMDQANGLFILVNKQNEVSSDYKPEDLTAIEYYASDRAAETRFMRAEAAEHFHRMIEAAQAVGYEIVMTTAYRSYGFQSILYDNAVKRKGEEGASKTNAKPGQSEHQTGLAVDISAASNNYQLTEAFGSTPEGQWISEHAHEYGFILRFPQGKEDITGYNYEPWHLRYVGTTAAADIKESGLALEEYLAQIKVN